MAEAVRLLLHDAIAAEIELKVDQQRVPDVLVESVLISQVMFNTVRNAIEALAKDKSPAPEGKK